MSLDMFPDDAIRYLIDHVPQVEPPSTTEFVTLIRLLVGVAAQPGESVEDVLFRCHIQKESPCWKAGMYACR